MFSLNRVVRIGVVCVVYSLLTQPGKVYAQADTSTVIHKLDEIVVSAQRAPITYSNMARAVNIIPRSEIDKTPVLNLNELLDYVPGVDIRQRGVNGVQADVSIQGGTFDQSLVLLNGINLSDPQTGHLSMNLPIDLESVSRVEVLKGSASRVFGANAFTGAINIITNPTDRNYIRLSALGGDFGLYKAGVSAQYNYKSFYNHLSYNKSASDGYTHNTDYGSQSVFYQTGINKKSFNLNFQGGYAKKNYGANSFYSATYPDQYEYNDTYFGSISSSVGNKFKLKPSVYWKRNYDHYVLIKSNPAAYQNFHFTDAKGINLNAEYTSVLGTSTLGFEYRNESIYSTRLGPKTQDSLKVKDQEGIYYNHYASRYNYSLFLEQSYQLNRFSISGGLMLNHLSSLNKDFVIYPSVDLAYAFTRDYKWYFTYSKALRLPTFTDLYYVGPTNISNVNLRPEEAHYFETGFKYLTKGFNGTISGYYRPGKNIIDWIWQADLNKWQAQNLTKLNSKGFEISTTFYLNDLLETNTFLTRASLAYSYNELSKNDGNLTSNYVLDNLKHKLAFNLSHAIYKKVTASWYLTWQDRNGTYGKYDAVAKTTTETEYAPFWLLDGKLNWNPSVFNLFFEVSNITNEHYYDIGNIIQPGRWFKVGVSIELGLKKTN